MSWTLQVACPDRPGLAATLSGCLFEHGANIVDADQHTDPDDRTFRQRIWFELPAGNCDQLEAALRRLADAEGMTYRRRRPGGASRVAIFVSRLDYCLYDLLIRHGAGELPGEIVAVVSNHPDLAPVAAYLGIPFRVIPIAPATRPQDDAALAARVDELGVDLVVLARYVQIVGPDLVRRYAGRMINIHHSFLPAFIGARPYHQAHERGVKLIGATAHYVTDVLDEGPIIEQDVIRATHRDTVDDLVRKRRDVERAVLGRAVRCYLEDRVLVYGNRTVVFA